MGTDKQMQDVYVFIVNYNSSELLEECLRSLENEPITRICIVDNFSSTEEQDRVSKVVSAFPRAVLTKCDRNLGFGPALNRAIDSASLEPNDVIWLLNPDTKVAPGAVKELSTFLQTGFDIVSPLILTGDEAEPRIWYSGGVLERRQVRTLHLGLGERWENGARQPITQAENTFITGAAMMMTYSTWKMLGGFREAFFLYWEDAELCERAVSMGLRLGVSPTASIWHAVGGSGKTSGMSETYYYYMQRNRLWFGRKWQSRRNILLGDGFFETFSLTFRPLKEKVGRFSKTASSIKGLIHGTMQPPA